LGDQTSVPLFAGVLSRSGDAEEGRNIESALTKLPGGGETDKAITAALQKATGSARAHLLTALGARQGRAANRLLAKEVLSPEPVVAKAAFRALGKTASAGDMAGLIDGLSQTKDPEVRAEAENAMAQALTRLDPARRSLLVRDALVHAHSVENRCSF